MDPIFVFLFSGFVSMSAALSAGAINKIPEAEREGWLASRNNQVLVVVLGNLAALTLVGAMAYGVLNLTWWLPWVCLFISFPVVHLVLFQRLLGDLKNLLFMGVLVVAAIPALYCYWQ